MRTSITSRARWNDALPLELDRIQDRFPTAQRHDGREHEEYEDHRQRGFLLAADTAITDPAILSQPKR
jgi:hypothetical protein